ncbi:hypothetical protein FRC01_008615 [Tulasnella sp. 417]|nr:hypothetical protein FRC01_008615 [Tulasnella sp. 417]
MSIPGNGFNGLPTEIVCDIFRLTIREHYARQDRCRLSLVCRQWRGCVDGSPLLWTDISATSMSPTYVRRALENSQGAMLDLRCLDFAGVRMEAFMAEVGLHIARWRSLTAVFPPWPSSLATESALAPLTTAQPPFLERLSLCYFNRDRRDNRPQNTVTLFGGAPAPSTLKHLTLLRFQLEVEPLRLSGLVSLELERVDNISTLQLLDILRGSPLLEALSLSGNPRLKAIGPQPPTNQPIELAKLKSLWLVHPDHAGARDILSTIRIPNRLRVYIVSEIGEVNVLPLLFTSATTHILHTSIPSANGCSSVIKVEESDGNQTTIEFRGMELLLVGGEDQIHGILSWLVGGLGSEAAECPVHLILDRSQIDPIPTTVIPPPLVVEHLSISGDSEDPWQENLYLAMARPQDSMSSGWLLPRLESISVKFQTVGSQKRFISMLRNRYQGATSAGETESTCPLNLRSVELRGEPQTEGLVEEIKEIIGEASVFWADDE